MRVILGNSEIEQVDSFICLINIISRNGECREELKSRIIEAQIILSVLEKFGRIGS